MNIVYLSSSCSEERFDKMTKLGMTRKLPQAQKYHRLLIEGLAKNIDGMVYVLSALPVNSQWTRQVFFPREEEKRENIIYIYGSFFNLPFIRQGSRIVAAENEVTKIYKEHGDCIIICDVLNQSLAHAARAVGKRLHLPVIGIVTDVPGHTSGARRKSYSAIKQKYIELAEKNSQNNLSKYDAYLFLTEAMNDVVNKNKKPYIVLEGHCDSRLQKINIELTRKCHPKVAMYAGGIHKEFGIDRLVNAFIRGRFDDWELHIYGDGNYEKELKSIAKQFSNVKYFGVQPNSLIVQKQVEASILLNPRLTDAEYVKYSFPSKTLECMASGTPLCTTKLPGMPVEYYPYVFLLNDETEEGMCQTLQEILNKDSEELFRFGEKAKEFVLKEKNNISQAKKLIEFAATL
jgi:glycosyltransferase involved in cell wall biosynthesis